MRSAFRSFKQVVQTQVRNKKLEFYTVQAYKKRKLQSLFDALRNFSHRRFLTSLDQKQL